MNKSICTPIALAGLFALAGCNKPDVEERREDALDKRHEMQEEALEQRQEREKETLEQRQQALHPADTQTAIAPSAMNGALTNAIADISAARCQREQRCGNIGPDKDYSSSGQCTDKIAADWREELNAYECPGGLVANEFEECLQAIRDEECASALDTLARVMACREADICRAVN